MTSPDDTLFWAFLLLFMATPFRCLGALRVNTLLNCGGVCLLLSVRTGILDGFFSMAMTLSASAGLFRKVKIETDHLVMPIDKK